MFKMAKSRRPPLQPFISNAIPVRIETGLQLRSGDERVAMVGCEAELDEGSRAHLSGGVK